MKVFKKLRGWISRHSWVKWVFSGVGVFVVAGILAAMSPKSHERPLIEQRTEGANSPNVVGNNNVLSYQAEPNERSLSPRFANALSPFAGQRFWIVAQTNDWDEASEQVRFARVIDSGLQAARWNKTQNITMKHRGSTEFREVPQPLYARIPIVESSYMRRSQRLALGLLYAMSFAAALIRPNSPLTTT